MKKFAFVTGAGGYIGSEVASVLARTGMAVAVCDINEEGIRKTVEKILGEGGVAKGYVADVSDSADTERAINTATEELGTLYAMVHVAGGGARIAGADAKYLPLADQEDYVIDRVLKVNLYGAIYCSRAAAKIMRAQGMGGRIINFSSIVGTNGLKYCTEYAVSKAGVIGLVKSLAKEVGEYGITVNAVSPGIVKRPGEQSEEYALKTNFLGAKCTAKDVAELVKFLTSDEAKFITGQNYIIDGGRSLAMKGTD